MMKALVDAYADPDEEKSCNSAVTQREFFVELWVEICQSFVDVAVEDERRAGIMVLCATVPIRWARSACGKHGLATLMRRPR